jgi:predicted methyltransferase
MTRRALTVDVDEKLLAAANAVAERTGVPIAELYDRALRNVLARDFAELMRDLAARQADSGDTLSDTEGLAVAHEELRATRADHRNAS